MFRFGTVSGFKSTFRSRFLQPLVAGAVLLSLVLTACAVPPVDADWRAPDKSVTYGSAEVEDIFILIQESFPVQVSVVARGYLQDGCTEIHEISQSFDEASNTFSIEITTVRASDALCTLALEPFEETISLDVLGLPAGTYTVDVNGVSDTFTLRVDNVFPEDEEGDADEGSFTPARPSVTRGKAEVEEISIGIMESFPVQVAVVARGYHRDGCTEIDAVRQSFDAATDTFFVEITTTRATEAICTMALEPFEERVSLEVRGLAAGTYTVDVNGVRDTFTLDADNVLPDDDGDSNGDSGTAPDEPVTYGVADIEEIDILLMESFPVQVAVVARGYLGDGCTEIHEINQTFDAATDTFYVEITTVRPTEAICILILRGLEERVSLDVHGLPAGTYTVDVNGVRDTFTLDADNAPAGGSGS